MMHDFELPDRPVDSDFATENWPFSCYFVASSAGHCMRNSAPFAEWNQGIQSGLKLDAVLQVTGVLLSKLQKFARFISVTKIK
jgi:hypothetical protein